MIMMMMIMLMNLCGISHFASVVDFGGGETERLRLRLVLRGIVEGGVRGNREEGKREQRWVTATDEGNTGPALGNKQPSTNVNVRVEARDDGVCAAANYYNVTTHNT
jgi:hypothetical protein